MKEINNTNSQSKGGIERVREERQSHRGAETAKESSFAVEPIGRLILKFAVPCVISLLVNALYNIVDQIFIGRGVGYLGNGATNVVFPITVIALAFSLLIGDGGASFLSLKLGEGDRESAQKGVGNAITMAAIAGIVLCAAALLFLRPIVQLFGATEKLLPYALDYGYIIVLGLPFTMMATAINSIVRADGSPQFAMMSMLIGAALNTVLDPIFIFVLHMGVQGAAIATVIGQIASFAFSVAYVRKFKSIAMHKETFRLQGGICRMVLGFGISSFITQVSITIVMGVTNNVLAKYGAESVYGAEIPLTAMGIVMKVNQILIAILVGIAAGSQPIIGYNYGAGNYQRVKKTLGIAIVSTELITLVAMVVFQFFPMSVISLFGSEEGVYNEFAVKCFRIFLLFCVLNGFQTVSGIYLQAVGKPVKSAVVSLSRQIVFLVPAALIIPVFMGVEGVLWAGPVADGLAFGLAAVMMVMEVRCLKQPKEQKDKEIVKGVYA